MLAIATGRYCYISNRNCKVLPSAVMTLSRIWVSILQFCVLSFVILPILPDKSYGPYNAFNLHHAWIMVVPNIRPGVSGRLCCFALDKTALWCALARIFPGAGFQYCYYDWVNMPAKERPMRQGRGSFRSGYSDCQPKLCWCALRWSVPSCHQPCSTNCCRRWVLVWVCGFVVTLLDWNRFHVSSSDLPLPETGDPTEIHVALGFGLLYAGVLLCSAWLSDIAGKSGFLIYRRHDRRLDRCGCHHSVQPAPVLARQIECQSSGIQQFQ